MVLMVLMVLMMFMSYRSCIADFIGRFIGVPIKRPIKMYRLFIGRL